MLDSNVRTRYSQGAVKHDGKKLCLGILAFFEEVKLNVR